MEWKPIKDYENYFVSPDGKVKNSLGKIMKPHPNTVSGLLQIMLWKEGRPKLFYVHRLVAMAFVHNDTGKNNVYHINGDKQDNNASNLTWRNGREIR